ncbi:hypothetical protein LINGRAHAP2_LOCUS14494 [Linum grandiflorum]
MTEIWRPTKGMTVKALSKKLFLFRFYTYSICATLLMMDHGLITTTF